jgi:hypothetical protein
MRKTAAAPSCAHAVASTAANIRRPRLSKCGNSRENRSRVGSGSTILETYRGFSLSRVVRRAVVQSSRVFPDGPLATSCDGRASPTRGRGESVAVKHPRASRVWEYSLYDSCANKVRRSQIMNQKTGVPVFDSHKRLDGLTLNCPACRANYSYRKCSGFLCVIARTVSQLS